MNSSNLFVLGLLLLTANLSFAALFTPARAGGMSAQADRLWMLWKILLLAGIQVGAWAIVLHQGGAAPTLVETFMRVASSFTFVGDSRAAFAPPWSALAPFIAMNGLMFLPVILLPLWRGAPAGPEGAVSPAAPASAASGTTSGEGAQKGGDGSSPDFSHKKETSTISSTSPAAAAPKSPVDATPKGVSSSVGGPPEPVRSAPEPVRSASQPVRSASQPVRSGLSRAGVERAAGEATGEPAGNDKSGKPDSRELERGGFRPKIPKALSPNAPLSPEEELAEQMKPIGPTPPPIRFEWKN